MLAVLSPESYEVVLLAEVSTEGTLNENGTLLADVVCSVDELSPS